MGSNGGLVGFNLIGVLMGVMGGVGGKRSLGEELSGRRRPEQGAAEA